MPASLAEIGYFTTLKIGGKSVDFGSVTDYWMEERPDHLVEFHVTMPLKNPAAVAKFLTLARRRSGIFHRLRIRRQGSGDSRLSAARLLGLCHQSQSLSTRPTRRNSAKSFFTNLSPGANFGFKMAGGAIVACP